VLNKYYHITRSGTINMKTRILPFSVKAKAYVFILLSLILIALLSACSVTPTTGPRPNSPTTTTNNPRTIQVDIPSSQVPPADVLQQIAMYAVGGGEMEFGKHMRFDDNMIILQDFQRSQRLRIFVYESTRETVRAGTALRYRTEWLVSADQNGQAKLRVTGENPANLEYLIVDASNGELLDRTGPIANPLMPHGGFEKGDIVTSMATQRLNIRSGPGYNNSVVAQVESGGALTITGASRTISGERWWPVKTENGKEGWALELWIEP